MLFFSYVFLNFSWFFEGKSSNWWKYWMEFIAFEIWRMDFVHVTYYQVS